MLVEYSYKTSRDERRRIEASSAVRGGGGADAISNSMNEWHTGAARECHLNAIGHLPRQPSGV